MAHRDSQATITAVDNRPALQVASSTAESIGLSARFEGIEGDPQLVELPEGRFDLVLLAQRVSCLCDHEAQVLLARAIAAAKTGGRIVVIDLFRGPTKANLAESVEALKLDLDTRGGRMRSLQSAQRELESHGLQQIQFTFLAASRVNMGLAVGVKPGTGK